MAYAAPELRNLKTSPSPYESKLEKQKKTKSTLFQLFTNKQVLNSVRWGFSCGTLIMFSALYHSNGEFFRALTHGTVACLVVTPMK